MNYLKDVHAKPRFSAISVCSGTGLGTGAPIIESPYGDTIQPQEAPESISRAVASLPPEQMFELMKQMKVHWFTGLSFFILYCTQVSYKPNYRHPSHIDLIWCLQREMDCRDSCALFTYTFKNI